MLQALRAPLKKVYRAIFKPKFEGSRNYWESRYASGGNSGAGSYNRLAEFKAEILNTFVKEQNIGSVAEFGSGDGAQLQLASYPQYVGIDVSTTAVELCRQLYANDPTKRFILTSELPAGFKAELTLSLDVIYHLVEDAVFDQYMRSLFGASTRFVAIYSSNMDKAWSAEHVRHRNFTAWVEQNEPNWRLLRMVKNRYPYDENDRDHTSFADFYFYEIQPRGS
ncbi:hypothetical protein [Dongia sp. agr-C8]